MTGGTGFTGSHTAAALAAQGHGVAHTAALVDLRRAAAKLVETTNARGVESVIGGAARRGLPSIVYVSSLMVFLNLGDSGITLP